MVGLCGLPPIEQSTLDGWGTQLLWDNWGGFIVGSDLARELECIPVGIL
jgi:hypothetical protein